MIFVLHHAYKYGGNDVFHGSSCLGGLQTKSVSFDNLPVFVISDCPRMQRCLPIWCTRPWPSLSTELEAVSHPSSWLKPSPTGTWYCSYFCDLLIFPSPWTKDLGLPSVKKQSCLIEKENLLPRRGVKCCHVVNCSKKGWSVLPSQINVGSHVREGCVRTVQMSTLK